MEIGIDGFGAVSRRRLGGTCGRLLQSESSEK